MQRLRQLSEHLDLHDGEHLCGNNDMYGDNDLPRQYDL